MLTRRCLVISALLFAVPTAARAQEVRGDVVDQTARPIGGVVVLLVDSTSRPLARALTDDQGRFRLLAPGAGSYRLRTLRIGYRPVVSDRMLLAVGGERVQHIVVAGLPVALDTIRVVDRNACRAFTDS